MIGALATKLLPIVLKGIIGQIPALKKLDKVVSYMEDDNELDIEVKAHRNELDVLKDQIVTLNDEVSKLMKKGGK